MGEGDILSEEEGVRHALDILRNYSAKHRGDSFDLGLEQGGGNEGGNSLLDVLSNPGALASQLNLTNKQAENIKALLVGGGAGLSTKYLSKYFGEEIAGAIGGFVGGYIVKKVIK